MPAHAIVIGIDEYANPAWKLDGAAADAVRFARWAVEHGGVDRHDLRLLLAARTPPDDLPYGPADRASITEAIQAFQIGGAGAGADRLYFYYAGHGLSAPGASTGFAQEPVILPADVAAIPRDQALCISFGAIIPALNSVEPREQVFFFDACRDFQLDDFQPGLGQGVGPYSPPRDPAATSSQLVLYAAAPGARAQEQAALRQGIFSDALLDGLNGAPPATAWNPTEQLYEVRFSRLVEHVRRAVRERIERLALKDHVRFLQVPEPLFIRTTDAVLGRRTSDEMEKVDVTVRVAPSAARSTCEVRLVYGVPGGEDAPVARAGPPVRVTETLKVSPGEFAVLARADAYVYERKACEVYAPKVIDLPMRDAPAVAPAPDSAGDKGGLAVSCKDPTALIVVFRPDRTVAGTQTGSVALQDLEPGIYRVRLVPAEGEPIDRPIEVRAGHTTTEPLDAAAPRLGDEQLQMLDAIGLAPDDDGFLRPSEILEPIALARLASLLGLAAFAAESSDTDYFHRLRSMGVRRSAVVRPGWAAALVILGVSGEAPGRGIDRDTFLGDAEVIVRNLEGDTLGLLQPEPLSGMAAAAQCDLELEPGCVTLELRVPGLAPTRYAVAALPGRVSVLVAVAEDSGAIDVHQYLVPIRGDAMAPQDFLADPRHVRRLEAAQRFYARAATVPDHRDPRVRALEQELGVADLLHGKWLDPLLGALAGYRLVRQGRAAEYRGTPDPANRPAPSAMQNMLTFFGGMPDTHVLAALCEPERRDEHFGNALERGLPVFAEGFRDLYAWYVETRPESKRPLWLEPSALLPGSPWTAWVAERPALPVRDGSFGPAPLDWAVLEHHRQRIEERLAAVGRLERPDRGLVGTVFAVAPGLVVTMGMVVADLPDGAVVDFGELPGSAARPYAVLGVERIVTPLGQEPLAVVRVAAQADDGTPFPPPLPLARRPPAPAEGHRVYVVGYPAQDPRVPAAVTERLLGGEPASKRLQLGQLLGLDPQGGMLRHDCLTLAGNAGSPLVDAETQLVVGVHYAGHWAEFKRGDAVALWPAADDPALAAARWS